MARAGAAGTWLLFLIAVALACFGRAAADDNNSAIIPLADSFWTSFGFRMPSKELRQAVKAAQLPVLDYRGRTRAVVLMSLTSQTALQTSLFTLFLDNLQQLKFARRDGTTSNLARHLVVSVMNDADAMPTCRELNKVYGSQFVLYANENSGFTLGRPKLFSPEYYGIGFFKIAALYDGLAAGADVLFLDSDQIFFQNPLPYVLAREADILVTGEICHYHNDTVPAELLPPGIPNNIGFLFTRTTPMTLRAVLNWGYRLTSILRKGGRPWDQGTFSAAMEFVSAAVSRRHLSLNMLSPETFPLACWGPCGCDLRDTSYYFLGPRAHVYRNGTCERALMERWIVKHMACVAGGNFEKKVTLMKDVTTMYQSIVGPINSLSVPLAAL